MNNVKFKASLRSLAHDIDVLEELPEDLEIDQLVWMLNQAADKIPDEPCTSPS